MKRILFAAAILCCLVVRADACGVACNQAYVQTAYAVPVGIPVAEPYALGYTYSAPSNVTVNVQLDSSAIADKVSSSVINALNAPEQQPLPQPPTPLPPAPQQTPAPPTPTPTPPVAKAALPSSGLFSEQSCTRCHNGANAKATAAIDMRLPLTCPQKLKAISDLVVGKMPLGAPLTDPSKAAAIIKELSQ